MKTHRNEEGFTLIELTVGIGLFSVVSLMTTFGVVSAVDTHTSINENVSQSISDNNAVIELNTAISAAADVEVSPSSLYITDQSGSETAYAVVGGDLIKVSASGEKSVVTKSSKPVVFTEYEGGRVEIALDTIYTSSTPRQ